MNAVKKLIASFGYALHGFAYCIKTCRNFRIHTVAAAFVMWLCRFYDFDKTTYALLLITVGFVVSFEAMNTALEEACDTNYSEKIKHAKDAAAGAVLCAAVFAVLVAYVLFWDMSVFARIGAFFVNSPINIVIFAILAVLAVIYIFYEDIFKHGK